MANTYDVIVVGLGAMGSATLHQLAHRGFNVLGIEKFTPGHANGSSHGKSRIIREAYFEDPRYVPLVQRAYECWRALEAESGVTVFQQTGGLMLGAPESEVVSGALLSARLHGLSHEVLTPDDVRRRYPAFRPRASDVGVVEPRAGMLAPEAAITAFVRVAQRDGAHVSTNEAMLSWRAVGDGVEVTTTGATYSADRLVLTVGAWSGKVLAELGVPFVPQRNVLYWFEPAANPEFFTPEKFPIFLQDLDGGLTLYGFPDTGDGVKVALHHYGDNVDPDSLRRTVSEDEIAYMRALLAQHMPDVNGALRDAAACMYTNVPDNHFVIDWHPAHRNVVVASPCSGHGFKFASALGEVLASMVVGAPVDFDTSLFSLDRFRAPS
jgi:sarcosine oxidase